MKRSSAALNLIVITSLFLLACSLVSLPGITTETPPTLTAVPSTQPLAEVKASPGLENENLLAELPTSFKVDYQAEQNNQTITEMVPAGESVEDWTTMVTVQVYLGEKNITPSQAQDNLTQTWFNACQNSETYPVADGAENGYSFVLWQLYCPLNPATQKVEYTYMKAIRGNDSFYLVQVAFRYEPTDEDITKWMKYLKEVQVCDSRIAEQACP